MKTPQHILLITPFAPPNLGGAETHLEDLYEYLRHQGYLVTLLTYQPLTRNLKGLSVEKKENLTIYRYQWFGNNLFAKFEAYPPLFNFLYITPYLFLRSLIYMIGHHKHVDIVHVFGLNGAFIARILKMLFRKKSIMSMEALYDFNPLTLLGKISRWVLKGLDGILVGSEESRNDVLKLKLPKEKVIEYIHWINLDRFKPLNKEETKRQLKWKDTFTALYVGRLIKIKGIEVFIDVAKKLPHVQFKVIGDNGPEIGKAIEADKALPNFEFLGKVENTKIAPYFAAADVFIYPALYKEDLARTLLEAMACGTPVINTNKGSGVYELDKASAFVTQGNAEAIAKKVDELAAHSELAESMSMSAVAFTKRFGPDLGKIITDTYKKLYAQP